MLVPLWPEIGFPFELPCPYQTVIVIPAAVVMELLIHEGNLIKSWVLLLLDVALLRHGDVHKRIARVGPVSISSPPLALR